MLWAPAVACETSLPPTIPRGSSRSCSGLTTLMGWSLRLAPSRVERDAAPHVQAAVGRREQLLAGLPVLREDGHADGQVPVGEHAELGARVRHLGGDAPCERNRARTVLL